MIEIKLPFKTPTINHLYWHKGNMKIMKTEARKLREDIKNIINKLFDYNGSSALTIEGVEIARWKTLKDLKLKVRVEIHEDWFTKKGEVKKKDVTNREKFLNDSVFNALGIDDKFIFEHSIAKVQDQDEFAIVKINALWGNGNPEDS